MNKSIIIFGKGISLLRATPEHITEYDDIAICNYPVLNNDFMKLIENRSILYHFANCGTFDERYDHAVNKLLQIKYIINTNIKKANNYYNYLYPKSLYYNSIFYDSINEKYIPYFKEHFNLNPSTGIMALQYILDLKQYNKILLIGFDNFEQNAPMYYYKFNEYNTKLLYFKEQNIISEDENYIQVNGHDPKLTYEYLCHTIKHNPDIKFNFITNIVFKDIYNNICII